MPLSAERARALAQVVADHVLLETIADIVAEDGYVPNFAALEQLALSPPEIKRFTIALTVVTAYDARNSIGTLKNKLQRRMRGNDFFVSDLADFEEQGVSAGHHEAAIVARARTLRLPELRRFLDAHEPKICVIAGIADIGDGKTRYPRGTGFLAAEDLVVTARHVLRHHIKDGEVRKPSPGPLYAFFDHLDGAPITDPRDPKIAARRVEFHQDWLQEFSDLVEDDGKHPEPLSADLIDELAKKLDMVLIKLAEPIGLYSRWRSGGPRRGWVTLPKEEIPKGLVKNDRILIPQHPLGDPQQIDFGRYKETDSSETRIRYDTETDNGTSGAPCFNQYFDLVGMHNGYFEPPGAASRLNQAIRFDHILKRIQARIQNPSPGSATRLWSVSEDPAKPKVIIGRRPLMSWIETAVGRQVDARAKRVYVATAKRPKCGVSFSVQILKAALRTLNAASDPVIVMGKDRHKLPTNAADFVAVIAEELGISFHGTANVPDLPARGNERLPGNSPDGDKPNLHAPRDLPKWLKEALLKQRNRSEGADDPAGAERMAQTRWERIWIALDTPPNYTFQPDIENLLTALIGAQGESEELFNEELRRIRWLFLGAKPDCVNEGSFETLDLSILSDDEIADCIRAFAESFNAAPPPEIIQAVLGFVKVRSSDSRIRALYENEATRLSFLQEEIAAANGFFTKALGAGRA